MKDIKEFFFNFILKLLKVEASYQDIIRYSKGSKKDMNNNFDKTKNELNIFDTKEEYCTGEVYSAGVMNFLEKSGEWKYFFKNGNLQKIVIHNEGNTFQKEEYYKTGEILKKSFITDLKEKVTETYYKTGEILSIQISPNYYEITGNQESYYEYIFYINGSLKEKKRIFQNRLVGNYEFYTEDGILIKKSFYLKDGNKEGKELSFYENGNLKIEEDYRNNLKQGFRKTYYRNGQLKEVILYAKDELVQILIKYNEKGERIG